MSKRQVSENIRQITGTVTNLTEAKIIFEAFPPENFKGRTKSAKCCNFIRDFCIHSKGSLANQPFKLEDWQKDIIRQIFDGKYKKVFITMARKNGKSLLIASIALFLLLLDDEDGKEVYTAAASRDQASLIFEMIAWMVKKNEVLSKCLKLIPSTKRIAYLAKNSYLRAISAEAYSAHGFNSYAVICDELHSWPHRELFDVLETSFGARANPLMISITTAGYDMMSICRELYDYGKKIQGNPSLDPTFLFICYELDEGDDWTDENVWKKANPGLGKFRILDEMKEMFQKARTIPAFENSFKRLYLNLWTRQESRWLQMVNWDLCNGKVDLEILKGKECYGGLDLSSTQDITAFSLIFSVDSNYFIHPTFWIPKENILERENRDRVPYQLWVQQGLIQVTEGNVIDYSWVLKEIERLGKLFKIKEIAFDRWGAAQITQELEKDGFTVVPIGQGYKDMSPPTKEFLNLVLSKRIQHGANPVLRWMADSVMVLEDPAANIKPDKSKSNGRIDGVVASIMALDRCLRHENTTSIYETRGVLAF